jgi:hypothetical protein
MGLPRNRPPHSGGKVARLKRRWRRSPNTSTRNGGERDATRARLVAEASHALWCFIVQREAIGLRDSKPVLRDYRVPAEVHNRMGAFRPDKG